MADAAGSESESDDDKIGLTEAYGVETPDDSRRLYGKWAQTYDSDFIEANGYVYHLNVASVFVDAGGAASGAVLDVGCGTGIVGVALGDLGENTVDGLDISPEMLEVAATKRTALDRPAYRNLIEADLTRTTPLGDDFYNGIVSSGTFTHGHVGPGGLDELVRVAAPTAVCAIGINEHFYAEQGFDRWFGDESRAGRITSPRMESVAIYEAMTGEHAGTRGIVAVFQVLG